MLHSMKELGKYSIVATDGAIGDIKDFYFDDEAWAVRYLVVDTSVWLPVRISRHAGPGFHRMPVRHFT